MSNSMSGNHSEKEKEHKERIRKLKARTSKMRAASIKTMDKRSIIRNQRLYNNAVTKPTLQQGEGPGIQGRDKKDIPYGQSYRTVGRNIGSYKTGPQKGQPIPLDPRRTYNEYKLNEPGVGPFREKPVAPAFSNKPMKLKKR